MKRMLKLVLIIFLGCISIYVTHGQGTIPPSWKLKEIDGIKTWIASKTRFAKGHRLIIYIEPRNYTLDGLKKVFRSLWSVNKKDDVYLSIEAYTSKNIVNDRLQIIGHENVLSLETLSDNIRSNEPEDLSFSQGKWYNADYFFSKAKGLEVEKMSLSRPNSRKTYKTIVLRKAK